MNFYGLLTKGILLYISDTVIQQVTHAEYLGVTIDEKSSWNKRILKITNKARQATGRYVSNCPTYGKCNIYKIMVCPILEYLGPLHQLKY